MESSVLTDLPPASMEANSQLYEVPLKGKDPYGEIANEFPYIDWVRVINVSICVCLLVSFSHRKLIRM